MAEDIRETGVVGLKGLKGINRQQEEDNLPTLEQLQAINKAYATGSVGPSPVDTSLQDYEGAMGQWGSSSYDDEILNSPMSEGEIQDMRYENQPWYDTLANGIGKMLGTAGTTFVSSLVGLPYGLFEAANQGRWSALWDNDVTKGLADVDKWLEDNMTNYRSQVQQNSPWYSPDNLFSMNFIADDVIKNAGFTLGAAASMAVGSGAMGLMGKSLGFVNEVSKGTKMGQAALSALFSATGEGMIEARQGVEERNKLEMQKLEDSFVPERNALEMEFRQAEQEYAANRGKSLVMGPDGRAVDPAYEVYKQKMADLAQKRNDLNQRYEAGKQQITESGLEMGNTILLANQALLTVGNLIQFGKGAVKSFDSARHAAEVTSKAAKPFGVRVTKAGADLVGNGYKITGKNFGKVVAATKGLLTEGSEEMNQQWIQSGAGAYYNKKDVNDYWKAKMDPEAYKDTAEGLYTFGKALDRGFQESWGDVDQWEQFVIGGLTGMAGSYSPTKLFNQDKTKGRLDPRRYGSWEGGAYNEISEFNRQYNQYEENINEVNRILQSEEFPERVRDMVGHTYTENEKTAAAEGNDKKAFKDAEDKQFVHDIQSFLRTGKLDDLRQIYKSMGENLSDEDVQSIVKSTTKKITTEEDKQNHDRMMDDRIALASTDEEKENLKVEKDAYVGKEYYSGSYVDEDGNQIYTDDEIRETVKHNTEELNRKLDSYLDSVDYVNRRTGGQLTKDQEDNLVYLHHLGKESDVRMRKIMADVRKQLPKKFLLKTSKTPEQLAQENQSSDLVFNKDENTKEGYVEVDTSLMNDSAFADFFQREVMRGGNIRPEFGETADEQKTREEEEKNLPEAEKKKKARERASKKWQDAIKKMQDDAGEQWDTNWQNLVDNFMENYKRDNNATLDETVEAFMKMKQDLQDASDLFDQAGEFQRTLMEYMQNPNKVEEAKVKEEAKANKANEEQQAKNKFEGKDAKQMKQELADGTMDFDDFSNFADMDLSGDAPAPLVDAQQEAKKAQESMQKANALKNHIQDQLGDNPSQQELNAAQAAMQMLDDAMLNAEDPSDISIDMPELNQVPLDSVDPNASLEDIDNLNSQVQGMLSEAFNSLNEDENAQDDIPEEVPADALNDVEPPTTGHDETTKTAPEVVAPKVSSPSKAAQNPVPKNPLTEGAISNIIKETGNVTNQPNTNGTWRSTTTRYVYGKSTGTYHETIADKNSLQYKRGKAIWEYLNSEGAFDRMDNASEDRIKAKDTVHFMVKFLPGVAGDDPRAMTTEERNASLAIIMMNDNGEVIGDLPLADFEPSYRSGNPTQQVKDLIAFQAKLFNAFMQNYSKTGNNEAIVDGILKKEGVDNLNLTFDNPRKSPLMSRVKQVMRGAVPYRYGEINTLNDVVQGTPEIAVKVTDTNVALKRGDKAQHKDVVIPKVGNIGQPYLLLPTASGEKIAVPFYMPAFNAEQHRNTELYKQLSNAIFYMLTSNGNSKENIETFGKNMDIIEGLLQVKRQEGAKRVMEVNLNNGSVVLHLQSLTDETQKIDISVPYSDDYAALSRSLADALNGTPINVSLQYLNDTIQTGEGTGARKASYNQVIGEIANVNLPKATTHTVNSWFTVELTTQAGTKPSKAVTTKTTGAVTEVIGGRSIDIDTDKLTAVDTATGEVIEDDEQVNLRLAQIKASKPLYKDKDFIQISIGGEMRTYDVKNNKFTKNPSNKVSSRRDFVKEIAAAESVANLIAIGEAAQDAQSRGEITANDLIKLTGYMNQKRLSFSINDVAAPKAGAVSFETTKKPQPAKPKGKTIEDIEREAVEKKIVGRQTKDAWAAIPDNLKLKLVNEGTSLQLASFTEKDRIIKNKIVIISMSDREGMITALKNTNMAAKAGNLKVSEVVKPMEKEGIALTKENEQAARRWLAKNLPSLSSEERTQFVDKLARMGDDAGKAWGSYRSGVIQIQNNAPMGTIYHEAFHYVMDMILNPEEQKEVLEIAMKEYGISDAWTASERLANDFRRYALDENAEGIVGRIRRLIRKLMDKIKRYNRISDTTINQLFWKINNGELAEKSEQIESFEETQQTVLMEIRNVQKEKYDWKNLSSDTKSALNDSGVSEDKYKEMSLEEKQQYVKCRG